MNEIKEILSKNNTIAMIGVSKDSSKPSTIVMKYMQKYGYKVILESNNIDYVENKSTKIEYQKIFLKKTQAFPVLINR